MSALPPHQRRVIDEKVELDGRLGRLGAFLDGGSAGNINAQELDLLCHQRWLMRELSSVLGQRIAAFGSAK